MAEVSPTFDLLVRRFLAVGGDARVSRRFAAPDPTRGGAIPCPAGVGPLRNVVRSIAIGAPVIEAIVVRAVVALAVLQADSAKLTKRAQATVFVGRISSSVAERVRRSEFLTPISIGTALGSVEGPFGPKWPSN